MTEANFSKKVEFVDARLADFRLVTLTPAMEAGLNMFGPNLDLFKGWVATGADIAEMASLNASDPESLITASSKAFRFEGCL